MHTSSSLDWIFHKLPIWVRSHGSLIHTFHFLWSTPALATPLICVSPLGSETQMPWSPLSPHIPFRLSLSLLHFFSGSSPTFIPSPEKTPSLLYLFLRETDLASEGPPPETHSRHAGLSALCLQDRLLATIPYEASRFIISIRLCSNPIRAESESIPSLGDPQQIQILILS